MEIILLTEEAGPWIAPFETGKIGLGNRNQPKEKKYDPLDIIGF